MATRTYAEVLRHETDNLRPAMLAALKDGDMPALMAACRETAELYTDDDYTSYGLVYKLSYMIEKVASDLYYGGVSQS